ncbi:alginate biosynthesis protein Alg44 [Pseudomonas fluorescens Q2-87]|uniref:Alginate biosynthesis protein Alg44 n=1 Tax=Pseudomonas fluorescens (strain Q2-87) TaxID=1038922 RepID=J2YC38_PSEFQ|nr:alginate biosynthesis protein Alg44 [Pseudomonas fluorescens]EJL04871.1 alginate biosynthesis protein Alg44 [Pseudomonas fluorescens Q2-87]
MNTAVNVNVVHESEAQRQHARVKIPAKLRFFGPDRTPMEVKVLDLSAGGLCFNAGQTPLRIGETYKARLQFVIDNLGLAMDVELQIRSYDRETGRTGCQFQNLEPRDISTLRHIITSHLAGDIVGVGDVLATLQRDNFTKARKQKDQNGGMTVLGRLRAVTFSLAIFLVGLAAFGFIFKSVYGMYFVSHAQAGLVNVQGMSITMPRDGTVQSLVKADGVAAKGAPLATFSTSMLDVLKGHLDDNQLQPAKVEELFGKQMTGTLTSPCDCIVSQQLVSNGQYASKGDVIFTLVPRGTEANVEARFSYRQFGDVRPGTAVSFQVAGEDTTRTGKIVSSTSLKSEDLSSDIRVLIKPDEPLDSSLSGRPVEVNSDRGPNLGWLMDKAMAVGR